MKYTFPTVNYSFSPREVLPDLDGISSMGKKFTPDGTWMECGQESNPGLPYSRPAR
jgi:hypothetical protein